MNQQTKPESFFMFEQMTKYPQLVEAFKISQQIQELAKTMALFSEQSDKINVLVNNPYQLLQKQKAALVKSLVDLNENYV